ncbi:MAG TPA: cell division protein ZapE [Pseudomonadales bacterium]|nr:cell division protein ZapE [Pseudomonadales bacterium]
MTPVEQYNACLSLPGFVDDPAQRDAVTRLDALSRRLVEARAAEASLTRRLKARFIGDRRELVKGLYMWGGVGRGKTFMMDLFFECLPFPDKIRTHFHRFMYRVHRDLRRLSGQANPLERVAAGLAGEARVLCFDEFFVSDIGDAMILGELLAHLFDNGVTLVATSNIPPRSLYENGLQRRRFLPAIDLLERNTDVLNLDGGTDYRLRLLEQAETYHSPLDDRAEPFLAERFATLAPDRSSVEADIDLEIEGRPIRCRRSADDVAWFDFKALCDGPRSQNDYIELARIYHAVLVSNVPVFTVKTEDQARRFISLVDEFYDHDVKLIVSAEAPVETLYRGERLTFEFERTRSRLLEMRSRDYLSRSHRA